MLYILAFLTLASAVLAAIRGRQLRAFRARVDRELDIVNAVVTTAASAPDVSIALRRALDQLCEATGWQYAEAWLPSRDTSALERRATSSGDAAVVGDELRTTVDAEVRSRAWRPSDVVWIDPSLVAVASMSGDEVVAVLVFFAGKSAKGKEEKAQMVARVAAQLSSLILRKRVEQSLLNERRFLAALFDNMREGVVACDRSGRITLYNRAAERMYNVELDDPWADTRARFDAAFETEVKPGDVPCEPPLARALRGETVRDQEWIVPTPDADERTMSVNAVAIVDGRGTNLGAVVASHDVTAWKKAEAAIRESERMKSEFVAMASHELRTPLTAIRGALGLLASDKLSTAPEQRARMVSVAISNTDRLIRLINDILDIERLESGKVSIEPGWCKVAEIARQVTEALRPVADRAGVALVVTGCEPDVWVDPDRLAQTFTNLIGNAIKFSPEGSVVELAIIDEDGVRFEVRDHGRGIPSDKLETIFERFRQVQASDAREKGGTGLGLAICRSIVEQHGGRIWVESTIGEGSTFCFTLPQTQGEPALV